MNKLTIGIKENDKVILLRTEEISDEFELRQFIKMTECSLNIFIKRDALKGGDIKNETLSIV